MKSSLCIVLLGLMAGSCIANADPNAADSANSRYLMSISAAINQYRRQHGLPPIQESIHLINVAEKHVNDLQTHRPDQGNCNMNSWSNKGNWKSCCYTDDHAQAGCMWYKPKELSKGAFNRIGYEIAASFSGTMDTTTAMQEWVNNPMNREIILNKGKWADKKWKYIGSAIAKNYAVAWFSEESE